MIEHFGQEVASNLIEQDIKILGSLEIWLCYFQDDHEYLSKISNYTTERLLTIHSSVRNKALSLLRKVTQMLIKNSNITKKTVSIDSQMATDELTFDRYIPDDASGYFDDCALGFVEPFSSYKVNEGNIPYFSLNTDSQGTLYLMRPEYSGVFIRKLFEEIIKELCIKKESEERKGDSIPNRAGRFRRMLMNYMSRTSNQQNNDEEPKFDQNLISKISNISFESARGLRYFNVFYQLLKYYGPDYYKNEFWPVIQEYVEVGFKDTEHPHVKKAFIVDVIWAFLKTIKYYQDGNEDFYNQNLQLVLDLYQDIEQTENHTYFERSLKDAFENRDPKRIEKFVISVIDTLSLSSPKWRSTLGFLNYITVAMGWKSAKYQAMIVEKILKSDPSEIPVQKNLAEISQSIHRLIIHKNWSNIADVIGQYIISSCMAAPDTEDPLINSLYEYLKEVLESLKDVEESEPGKLLTNNVVLNVITLYEKIKSIEVFGKIPQNLNNLAFELSFVTIKILLQTATLDKRNQVIEKCIFELYSDQRLNDALLSIEHHKTDSNWRMRENYLYILKGIISVHTRKLSTKQLKACIDIVLPFFYDENIYVRKFAVANLTTILSQFPKIEYKTSKSTDSEPELVGTSSLEEIVQMVDKYKTQVSSYLPTIKKQADDSKEIKNKAIGDLNILLAISYSWNYTIPDFLPPLCLFMYKAAQTVPEFKSDLLEFIKGFKSVHQDLVRFQSGRFEEEKLQLIQDVFSISASQSMAY